MTGPDRRYDLHDGILNKKSTVRVAFPKAVLTEKNRGWLKDWYIWVEDIDQYQFKLVEKHPGWIIVEVPND